MSLSAVNVSWPLVLFMLLAIGLMADLHHRKWHRSVARLILRQGVRELCQAGNNQSLFTGRKQLSAELWLGRPNRTGRMEIWDGAAWLSCLVASLTLLPDTSCLGLPKLPPCLECCLVQPSNLGLWHMRLSRWSLEVWGEGRAPQTNGVVE